MKKVISILLACSVSLSMAIPAFAAETESVKIYVSAAEGNDENMGTSITQPVKTVQKATELMQEIREDGVKTEIIFAEGEYFIDGTLELTAEHSGTADAPVVYRAYQGAQVSFTNSKKVEGFVPTTNTKLSANVYEADLSDFANLKGDMSETLYVDGEMQFVAAYPNRDEDRYTLETDTDLEANTYYLPYERGEMESWAGEENIYAEVRNYSYTWSTNKMTIVDEENWVGSFIYIPSSYYNTCRFYNILAELDTAGEYYVDAANQKLYYYPANEADLDSVYLATGTQSTVTINGADHIRFEGIDFFCGTKSAVAINLGQTWSGESDPASIDYSEGVVVYDSNITGYGEYGIYGIFANETTIAKSNISDMKRGGILLTNTNTGTPEQRTIAPAQRDLTMSNNIIRNCRVYDCCEAYYTAGAGINVGGVGTTVTNCEVFNMPSTGIMLSGSLNTIENNKVYNVVDSAYVWDAGAIYIGRSWVDIGNVIRNNYIYQDFTKADYESWIENSGIVYYGTTDNAAIYADDLQSDVEITGNVIYNMSCGFLIGGGSDITIKDNYVINSRKGYEYDNQGTGKDAWTGWRQLHLDPTNATAGAIYKRWQLLMEDYNEEAYGAYEGFVNAKARMDYFASVYELERDDGEGGTYTIKERDEAGTMTDADKTLKIEALRAIGDAYGADLENNTYTGAWAQWFLYSTTDGAEGYAPTATGSMTCPNYLNNSHFKSNDFGEANNTFCYDEVLYPASYSLETNAEAGVTINGYEIAIANTSDTTALGVQATDDYTPSYSASEYVDAGNVYNAVIAVYDGDNKLKATAIEENVYLKDGEVDVNITIPEEATTGWYLKVMLWDSVQGMVPLLKTPVVK